MHITPINKAAEEYSQSKLQAYYANDMISAEKKNYLTKHEASSGPYMAVEGSDGKACYLLDAASQIATLGLGFNPSVFMGTAHQLSSWVNRTDTPEYFQLRSAFDDFMTRKSGWPSLETTICNSGAEANETALGFCYRQRVNRAANKVLAFEGSFHGRMLISLASTWNPSKREPFQFPGYETEYCTAPALPNDEINVEFPENWISFWEKSVAKSFEQNSEWLSHPALQAEVNSLNQVREKLVEGKIFAIIIEPMQCEGGDRYLSNRFHSALIAMAKSFQVPVIHDEVQTGFHLGRDFFWHVDLDLHDDFQNRIYPDYVTCAKKAQVGLVLSHEKKTYNEQFHVASLVRGYLHAVALDQNSGQIEWLEVESRKMLEGLISKYAEHIESPRLRGMSFAFDIKETSKVAEFINIRFEHGLLYYPAGSNTLRFRLNTAFKKEDLDFLFQQLDLICDRVFNGANVAIPTVIDTPNRDVEDLYFWQQELLQSKLGPHAKPQEVVEEFNQYFSKKHDMNFIHINGDNFSEFKDKIIQLEEATYEPSRQTDIIKFEQAAKSRVSTCFALLKDDDLVAIAFASSLSDHASERGVRRDRDFQDPNALYMIDTTVDSRFQGHALGRKLKYALSLYASMLGAKKICGRNRDRLAGSMLNINLSLGALETQYVTEDYLDDLPYRDVLFYEMPLRWEREDINLSSAINSPLSFDDLTPEFLKKTLPSVTNKVCLSNFVNTDFLDEVKSLFNKQPDGLQHGYTASGQSECVDKIAKSIWYNSEKKTHKMLTLKGHYFGDGSFLSRSLSSGHDNFFPVTHLPTPFEMSEKECLENVEKELASGDYMAFWLEPIEQRSMRKLSMDFLRKVREFCTQYKVALVYNETASSLYRYNADHFFCANLEGMAPDVSMTYLGGQIGIVNLTSEHFVSKPLMMISTWDGDEFSLSKYLHAVKRIECNIENYNKAKKDFEAKLKAILDNYPIEDLHLENAKGSFKGNIPTTLANYFDQVNGRYLICPNYSDLKSFISIGENL